MKRAKDNKLGKGKSKEEMISKEKTKSYNIIWENSYED